MSEQVKRERKQERGTTYPSNFASCNPNPEWPSTNVDLAAPASKLHAESKTTVKINVCDNVIFRILGGEAVLLNVSSGTYFGLNEVGTRIWQLISEHGSAEKILEVMLEEYDVERDPLQKDLDKLLKDLLQHDLVSIHA